MDYQVLISKPALADLETIVRFAAQVSGPKQAERMGSELFDVMASRNHLPNRGSPVQGHAPLRKLSHRYYLIYYRVVEDVRRVEVVRIWDGRQRPADLHLP